VERFSPGGFRFESSMAEFPGPGLRLAIGTLSILRARVEAADRGTAGRAMACAPLVGAGIGVAAAAVGWAARAYTDSTFLAAVAAVATYAIVTRALHLDGLADVADGLGSAKPREQALEIMKKSDIGPFGVATLVLVLALQIAGATGAYAHHRGGLAIIIAAATSRLAITLACTPHVPSARTEGLGAWVAGTVSQRTASLVATACLAACFGLGFVRGLSTALLTAAACIVGTACALLLLRRCMTRFGGITGDVLGALVETSAAAALLVLAAR
jgi:adenosylcobinamide-GDP ribazoletransferase